MFQRYKYHLDLIKNIMRHIKMEATVTEDLKQSTVVIFGRLIETYRKLFDPLSCRKLSSDGNFTYILSFLLVLCYDCRYHKPV